MSVRELDLKRTGTGDEVLPDWTTGSQNYGWWGMILLIGTEAMMFGALIASYWYLRYMFGSGWPGDVMIPKLELPLIMTALLWSSSIPVHIADKACRKGNQGKLRLGLLLGFLLGAVFLFLQVAVEYPEKLKEFDATGDVYGSLFFALTGLHGSHVAVGLCINLWVQARAWLGHFGPQRHVSVQNFALYWHFVDTVWLFILITIYLAPHFA